MFPSREAARRLGIGRNKMMAVLRKHGFLDGGNYPTLKGKTIGLRWLYTSGYSGYGHDEAGATWYTNEAILRLNYILSPVSDSVDTEELLKGIHV